MGRQISYSTADRTVVCSTCKGVGVIPRKVLGPKPCPDCGGTGRQKPATTSRSELSDATPQGKETLEHLQKVQAEKKRRADKKRRKARKKWEREQKRKRHKKWTAEEVEQLQKDIERKKQEKVKRERKKQREQKQKWKQDKRHNRGPLG